MARRTNADLVLEADRQRAIAEARRQPEYARVFWDFDKDTWAIECRPCGKPPRVATKDTYLLTDKAIKAILETVVVRHNQQMHGVSHEA